MVKIDMTGIGLPFLKKDHVPKKKSVRAEIIGPVFTSQSKFKDGAGNFKTQYVAPVMLPDGKSYAFTIPPNALRTLGEEWGDDGDAYVGGVIEISREKITQGAQAGKETFAVAIVKAPGGNGAGKSASAKRKR